jgi:hypothetical protein
MELPTQWSCSANEGGVLDYLFCYSETIQYEPARGVGLKLHTNACTKAFTFPFSQLTDSNHLLKFGVLKF